jgi:hypothetical protein
MAISISMQTKRRKLMGDRNKTRTKNSSQTTTTRDLMDLFRAAPLADRGSDSTWRSSAFYRELAERVAGADG